MQTLLHGASHPNKCGRNLLTFLVLPYPLRPNNSKMVQQRCDEPLWVPAGVGSTTGLNIPRGSCAIACKGPTHPVPSLIHCVWLNIQRSLCNLHLSLKAEF